ncbi:MAG TPA: type I polyketide synthase, partial [Solirubrobacterales bacterium]
KREISIHSRPEAQKDEEPAQWTQNASGLLSEEAPEPQEPLEAWPPEGAEAVDVEFLYDRLAEAGLEYGPAFQGLTAAWREGETVFAEVSLAEEQAGEAERYGLHPALFDAALHTLIVSIAQSGAGEGLALPFAWGAVSLYGSGAGELRVRLKKLDAGVSLFVVDPAGDPIAEVGSLSVRPISPEQLQGQGSGQMGLLGIEWGKVQPGSEGDAPFELTGELTPLRESLDEEDAVAPATVLWRGQPGQPAADPIEGARSRCAEVLRLIQEWLAAPELGESRLVILTENAIAAVAKDSPDPAAAAAWGLVRSAQSEHPGRFALIDTDCSEASLALLPAAVGHTSKESQLALRDGSALAPRAARLPSPGGEETPPLFDPERTVLITGATGGLGALTSRHLVEAHGARHLLLVSRSGPEAEGAEDLESELRELGADVRIVACDVSKRDQLEKLFASIPEAHSLGAVVHIAGVLDDATIDSLTPERLDPVFAPKVDAAWHLHELSAGMELSSFVLFSSAAGTLGGPGQGNYAAANVFLDGLAQRRRAEGLAGTSIAWGLWAGSAGMAAGLSEMDLTRLRRVGVVALPEEQGLALFDQAVASGRPDCLAMGIDPVGLRSMAAAGFLPPILSGLVRVPKRRPVAAGSLVKKLASMPEADHGAHVLELVKTEVANVLGHDSGAAIEPDKAFLELGFDSLAAVELRNRLAIGTGMQLPPTVVFDYPSSAALAEFLVLKATAKEGQGGALESQESEVRDLLATIPLSRLRSTGLLDSLVRLAREDGDAEAETTDESLIDEMDVEELIRESIDGGEDADGAPIETKAGEPNE